MPAAQKRAFGKSLVVVRVLIALFAGAAAMFSSTISFTGNVVSHYPENFPQALTPASAIIFAVVALVTYLALWGIGVLAVRIRVIGGARPAVDALHAGISKVKRQPMRRWMRRRWKALLGMWAFVFVCWGVVLLNYYPGVSMNDQLWIISSPIATADNHPLVHNLLLAAFVRGGAKLLGSANAGLAAYTLVQMAVCAAIVSFCALWLRYRRAPRWACIVFCCIFALVPIFQIHAISCVKDTYFSYFMLLWAPYLTEMAMRGPGFWRRKEVVMGHIMLKRSPFAVLFLLLLMPALLRSNGLYVSLAMAVIVVIAAGAGFAHGRVKGQSARAKRGAHSGSRAVGGSRAAGGSRGADSRQARVRVSYDVADPVGPGALQVRLWAAGISVAAIAVALGVSMLATSLGASPLFREKIGIPLQQISAVVCADPDSLSQADCEIIESFVPLETIQERYAPMSVDMVKYAEDFDYRALQEHQAEFWDVYFRLGAQHPALYAQAYEAATWGIWAPNAWDDNQSYLLGISYNEPHEPYLSMAADLGLANTPVLPEPLAQLFSAYFEFAVCLFPGPGLCFLIMLVLAYALMAQRGPRILLVVVPFVLLWGTLLLAAPLATALRYVLPLLLVLPLLAGMLLIGTARQ